MDAMTKRFRTLRQSSVDVQEVDDTGVGLFIAPKKTLLDHYLAAVSLRDSVKMLGKALPGWRVGSA